MKEKISLGLDIGNRHVNMVKLGSTPEGMKLLDFASVGLNPRLGREEKCKQLEKLVQEKGIAGLAVNIGIAGEAVVVRYIDLPRMSEKELTQALKFEAQQYIPFKMEEVIFDYHILEPVSPAKDSNSSRMKILLAAAKKQAVTEYLDLIQRSGLQPNLIDVNSFSLINCFQANGPRIEENNVFALVNLEFDLVNINILQGQVPLFTRDISFLEDILSLRLEEEQGKDPLEVMQPLLANLIREIRLSINYYESEFEKQVYLICLSGEGARSAELISLFNTQLGREVNVWNPLQNLLIDSNQPDAAGLKQSASMLALACGLALRGTG